MAASSYKKYLNNTLSPQKKSQKPKNIPSAYNLQIPVPLNAHTQPNPPTHTNRKTRFALRPRINQTIKTQLISRRRYIQAPQPPTPNSAERKTRLPVRQQLNQTTKNLFNIKNIKQPPPLKHFKTALHTPCPLAQQKARVRGRGGALSIPLLPPTPSSTSGKPPRTTHFEVVVQVVPGPEVGADDPVPLHQRVERELALVVRPAVLRHVPDHHGHDGGMAG